jgi:hypothetical protein
MDDKDRDRLKYPLKLTLQGVCIYLILSIIIKDVKSEVCQQKENSYHRQGQTPPCCLCQNAFTFYFREEMK